MVKIIEQAEAGDLNAQKKLYGRYMKGKRSMCSKSFIVGQNYDDAFFWCQKAAGQGDSEALLDLGVMYINGLGCKSDYNKAEMLISQAEANFTATKICKLKRVRAILCKRTHSFENYKQLVFEYSQIGRGCSSCDSFSKYRATKKTCPWFLKEKIEICRANLTEYGSEFKEGMCLLESFAEKGCIELIRELAYEFEFEKEEGSREKFFKYTRLQAKYGDSEDQYSLYLGWKINYYGCQQILSADEAYYWLKKSAENGCPYAYYDLAICYENGTFYPQNKLVAFEWYQKAAKLNDYNALYRIAEEYEKGGDIYKKNSNRAFSIFEEIYNYNDDTVRKSKKRLWLSSVPKVKAALRLGHFYEIGLVVKKDYDEALKYYQYAFRNGCANEAKKAISKLKKKQGVQSHIPKPFVSKRGMAHQDYYPNKEDIQIYTNGTLRPCPHCKSDDVEIFADGTAHCNKCGGWYVYQK